MGSLKGEGSWVLEKEVSIHVVLHGILVTLGCSFFSLQMGHSFHGGVAGPPVLISSI